MQSKGNVNLRGIDISNHQANVDFGAIKNSGIQVVYMKASESNFYRDAYLDQNYAGAKAQGLKVGFYHFFRCDVDAVEQARFFVNCIQGKDADCKLCIDIETTEGQNADTITSMCIAFLEEVKRLTSKDVVVYTYTSFAKSNLTSAIGGYSLWIADYRGESVLPNDNPIWGEWIGYQFASDGIISGVSGNCDVDEFTEDILLGSEKHFNITLYAHVQDIGNTSRTGQDDVSIGTTGKELRMEALAINIEGTKGEKVDITYDTHMEDVGDLKGQVEGQIEGSMGQMKRLEGITIYVKAIPEGYKLQYMTHCQNIGWSSDWVEAGQFSGTRGQGLRMEALRVRITKA